MVKASASRAVDWVLIPSRVKPMTLKLVWYSQLLCLTLSITGTVWRTSRQVRLLCHWERHLAGFPHFGVVDRWLATPKRARIAHWSLSRDRRIHKQQNQKTIRDIFVFCNCPQIANLLQFFKFICKPIFLINFFS